MGAVALTVAHTTILLIAVTPAGVFTGLLPLMMVGFADEYLLWGAARARESG